LGELKLSEMKKRKENMVGGTSFAFVTRGWNMMRPTTMRGEYMEKDGHNVELAQTRGGLLYEKRVS